MDTNPLVFQDSKDQNIQETLPENNVLPKRGKFSKHFWLWVSLIVLLITVGIVTLVLVKKSKEVEISKNESNKSTDTAESSGFNLKYQDAKYPKCPANLVGSGLLTSPILPMDKITAIIPLGHFSIPTHILPVDHNYFGEFSNEKDRVPVYAPGNLPLVMIKESTAWDKSGAISSRAYDLYYVVCRGVVIVISSADTLSGNVANLISGKDGVCKEFNGKHEDESKERQCGYQVDYQTNSGEVVGETGYYINKSHSGEVWAFNYNITPDPEVDWSRWSESEYESNAFCLFDLYGGKMKDDHEAKMGRIDMNKTRTSTSFIPRTVAPLCGQIYQDLKGSIQGSWFGDDKTQYDKGQGVIKTETIHLALVPDNINPKIERIVDDGNLTGNSGSLFFIPKHQGTINRSFSEVGADNQVYCYSADIDSYPAISGKVLVQLIDTKHLRVEMQNGSCNTGEMFKNPFAYSR